jgi:hypothetical protein
MLVEQIVKLFCPKWALNLYGKREESVHVCHYEEETPLSTSHRNMRLRCSFSIRLSPCYAHAVAQPNAKKICLEASLAKKNKNY